MENLKKELLERKKKIMEELNKVADKGEYRAKFPDLGDKPEENVQEIDEYSTNLATEKILESTLRDIDSALERIKKGTYGVCKYCDKEIGEKRLLARPVASACVECKSKLQKGG